MKTHLVILSVFLLLAGTAISKSYASKPQAVSVQNVIASKIKYPLAASEKLLEGKADIRFKVDSSGKISFLKVDASDKLFENSVTSDLASENFKSSALLPGNIYNVTVTFKLE